MTKAVVFDFDGVLGDTWDLSVRICRDLNLEFTLDDYRDHHNGNVYEEPKLKFSEEQVAGFYEAYEKAICKENLFPLKEQLEKIRNESKIFIISSNSQKVIEKYLEIGGWKDLVEKVYGVETHRSKVKKFEILLEEHGFEPENCIFVTDTLGDLIEGERVGVRTLAVTWGYHGEMRLRKGNPSKVVHEFSDLAKMVEGM